ncbi:MAG TPA: hypothetical protein VEA17_24480 [Bordetella sp.]|nr:hypothetical protein [Bordetella sp.]
MTAPRLLASWALGLAVLLPNWAAAGSPGQQALAAYRAAQGDPAQLRQALALADQALQQAPGDTGLRMLRGDIHIALRQYSQALADYTQLSDTALPPERKLLQCMLRERVQPAPLPLACYADAGKRLAAGQQTPERDPNYIMAQLLARAPGAARLAAGLLAATPAGPQRDVDAMLFQDFDRNRYLHSVLP